MFDLYNTYLVPYLSAAVDILEPFNYIILIYFLGINLSYLALVIASFLSIKKQQASKEVFDLSGIFSSDLYRPVSILAPAYNEEATITASVHSLLQLEFPDYEIIVINDGSTDNTLDILKEQFDLKKSQRYVPLHIKHKPIKAIYESAMFPELVVVDKENGRKADSLNAGINASRKDLLCAIDSDSVLESDVLLKLLRSFVEDESTVAVGGIIRVANNCRIEDGVVKEVDLPTSYLGRIQAVEYLRAFLFGRVGWDYLDSLLIISGAFGVFDREAVLKVGGYLHDTVGEDMELVVRLHNYYTEHELPYRVRFLAEPVCWTEVPEDWQVLSRQRNRWQRGLADTLWRHKKMLLNPRYGNLGMIAMPFFFFFEMFGPVIELIGFVYFALVFSLGLLDTWFSVMFLGAAILLGLILSIAAVICEEMTFRRYPKVKHVFILSLYAFIENFGYRQIHSWWRLRGLIDFLKGDKEWGIMTRKGFGNSDKKTKDSSTESLWKRMVDYWKVARYGVVIMLVIAIVGWMVADVILIYL